MNPLLGVRNYLGWLAEGRTILILKDPKKSAILFNYHPIIYHNTTWSVIIATKVSGHIAKYLSGVQKGISKKVQISNTG